MYVCTCICIYVCMHMDIHIKSKKRRLSTWGAHERNTGKNRSLWREEPEGASKVILFQLKHWKYCIFTKNEMLRSADANSKAFNRRKWENSNSIWKFQCTIKRSFIFSGFGKWSKHFIWNKRIQVQHQKS